MAIMAMTTSSSMRVKARRATAVGLGEWGPARPASHGKLVRASIIAKPNAGLYAAGRGTCQASWLALGRSRMGCTAMQSFNLLAACEDFLHNKSTKQTESWRDRCARRSCAYPGVKVPPVQRPEPLEFRTKVKNGKV